MPDRNDLRQKLERQAARDDTRRRHWTERRERRVLRVMESPVLPAFCRVCLAGMLAGSFMAATGDLALGRSCPEALKNAAGSALLAWLTFGVPLAIGCLLQLRRGFNHPWFEQHRLNRRGRLRMPWPRKYRLWLAAAVIGAAALAGLCLAVRGFA